MALDLFAGVSVNDYDTAVAWYEKLLGAPPSFLPNDIEAVWELGEHQFIYIEVVPKHAGHAQHTLFVEDFEGTLAAIAGRGLEPAVRETYDNGVRHATYYDPDGNEISYGGPPVD
jgi:catechol 2,3-dioxygenase-like lactoylglutathione lyase family enzyme